MLLINEKKNKLNRTVYKTIKQEKIKKRRKSRIKRIEKE